VECRLGRTAGMKGRQQALEHAGLTGGAEKLEKAQRMQGLEPDPADRKGESPVLETELEKPAADTKWAYFMLRGRDGGCHAASASGNETVNMAPPAGPSQ
jgi:hypothetical protein